MTILDITKIQDLEPTLQKLKGDKIQWISKKDLNDVSLINKMKDLYNRNNELYLVITNLKLGYTVVLEELKYHRPYIIKATDYLKDNYNKDKFLYWWA